MTDEQLKKLYERLDSLSRFVADHAIGIKHQDGASTQAILKAVHDLDRKLDKIINHFNIPDDEQ